MTADYRKSTAESEIRELIDARAKAIREKNANAILSVPLVCSGGARLYITTSGA